MTQDTIDTRKEDTTYNGWTNYETWCVNLWLDNNEYTQGLVYEMANSDEYDNHRVASLEEMVEEWREEWKESGSSMFDDLLGAALGSVNWYEIIETAKDEDYDPED